MDATDEAGPEHELTELNRSIADLEQQRDAEAIARLDALISPSLIIRRSNGSVVGKAEFMAGLEGPSPFASRTSDEISVAAVGGRALVALVVATERPDGSSQRFPKTRGSGSGAERFGSSTCGSTRRSRHRGQRSRRLRAPEPGQRRAAAHRGNHPVDVRRGLAGGASASRTTPRPRLRSER